MTLKDAIITILLTGEPRRRYGDLWTEAGRQIGRAVQRQEFDSVISELAGRERLSVSSGGTTSWVHLSGQDAGNHPAPTESQLMPQLDAWLRSEFPKSFRYAPQFIVKNTSQAGLKSGVWSRPDFTVALMRRFRYSTLREIDLFGFELKKSSAGSVIGVHESYAHTRYVHFSYLVWHVPNENSQRQLEPVQSECARLGVGLVTFSDPHKIENWRTLLEPEKAATDPHHVEAFIEDRFAQEERNQLAEWIKG
jgi:hypothetical protein